MRKIIRIFTFTSCRFCVARIGRKRLGSAKILESSGGLRNGKARIRATCCRTVSSASFLAYAIALQA
ncbi:unnamed protein product, partial [Nesidiocoris tenuis]